MSFSVFCLSLQGLLLRSLKQVSNRIKRIIYPTVRLKLRFELVLGCISENITNIRRCIFQKKKSISMIDSGLYTGHTEYKDKQEDT